MARAVAVAAELDDLDALMDAVAASGEGVIVERQGKPSVALISVAEFEQLAELRERERRRRLWKDVQRLQAEVSANFADLSDEEIERIADEVSQEVVQSLIDQGKITFAPVP